MFTQLCASHCKQFVAGALGIASLYRSACGVSIVRERFPSESGVLTIGIIGNNFRGVHVGGAIAALAEGDAKELASGIGLDREVMGHWIVPCVVGMGI